MDDTLSYYDTAIIGAGASGVFAAISEKLHHPKHSIAIFEKTTKSLAKVKISGGGRCNVTHACFDPKELCSFYPRGKQQLVNSFFQFYTEDIIHWFESKNVKLKTEEDGRIFPVSNQSQTIIDCFMKQLTEDQTKIRFQYELNKIQLQNNQFELQFSNQRKILCTKLILSCGGYPKLSQYHFLQELGIAIQTPVASLFTFNIPNSEFRGLEGISVESVEIKTNLSKQSNTGPLLFTHWGLSGPGVIKLSSILARELAEANYSYEVVLNFLPAQKENDFFESLKIQKQKQAKSKLKQILPNSLATRLKTRLLELIKLDGEKNLADCSFDELRQLCSILFECRLKCNGKTSFKEEFVVCGGVDLSEINLKTMESKKIHNLFFTGEMMDVDGFTGGFNFQHAWTSAWIAGKQG